MGELLGQSNGQKPAQSVRPPHQEWLERFWAWLGRKSLGTKIITTVVVLCLGWLFLQFTNSVTNSINECGWDGVLSRCFKESFFEGSKAQNVPENHSESYSPNVTPPGFTPGPVIVGATIAKVPVAPTAPAVSVVLPVKKPNLLILQQPLPAPQSPGSVEIQNYTVLADTELRATAEPYGYTISKLPAGVTVKATKDRPAVAGWVQIQTYDGQTGFVEQSDLLAQ